MTNLTNYEVIEHILQVLISKIGRRTSMGFAAVTVDTILKELKLKYDFLKYIKVQDTSYSEGMDAVNINPDINSVESDVFYKFINDIIRKTIRHLKDKADFFFIREFQEAIDNIADLNIKQDGIDLGCLQLQYIVDRKQISKIKNSEAIENVIRSLTILLNKIFPEKQAVETMIIFIKKLGEEYDFFKYIEINDSSDLKGIHFFKALPDINNVSLTIVAEAIEKLIREVSISVDWDDDKSFLDAFKIELGEMQLSRIVKIGVNLNNIQNLLLKKKYQEVAKKTLEALIIVCSKVTSENSAILTINNMIKNLKEKHDVLKYIKIDESRHGQGADVINVMPELSNVKPSDLGRALRDIIKTTGKTFGTKNTASIIEDFKKQLGEEYQNQIKDIGVNLQFLELRFV